MKKNKEIKPIEYEDRGTIYIVKDMQTTDIEVIIQKINELVEAVNNL
jgi:hypothetical protein